MSPLVKELTPRGRGGITVLEVSGDGAREGLERIAARLPPIGRFGLVRIALGEDSDGAASNAGMLDEALVIRCAPDHFEVHLTGSPPLVRRVAALLARGAPALDLRSVEERAWSALASAPCEAAARVLLDQSRGALRRALEAHVADSPADWRSFLDELAEDARVAGPLLRPVELVLAGPTNAGKSTLFNVLVGRERVAVSDEPGTTRDPVEAEVLLGAWPVTLVDTAGERGAEDDELGRLERLGQERSRGRTRRAALSIWLDPADAPAMGRPFASTEGRWIRIESRADLGPGRTGPRSISALRDPIGARATIASAFREALDLPEHPWRSGVPVPFEPDLLRALAELAHVSGGAARSELLCNLLGPLTDPTGAGIGSAERVVGRSGLG